VPSGEWPLCLACLGLTGRRRGNGEWGGSGRKARPPIGLQSPLLSGDIHVAVWCPKDTAPGAESPSPPHSRQHLCLQPQAPRPAPFRALLQLSPVHPCELALCHLPPHLFWLGGSCFPGPSLSTEGPQWFRTREEPECGPVVSTRPWLLLPRPPVLQKRSRVARTVQIWGVWVCPARWGSGTSGTAVPYGPRRPLCQEA
jgi:hypothetical protein